MNKLLQTTLIAVILSTSIIAMDENSSNLIPPNTIEGNCIWHAGTVVTIENEHTTTIKGGTIRNRTDFVIKNYSEGNTATVILDKESTPEGNFINEGEIFKLNETSQVVKNAGFSSESEYNIEFGTIGDGISFQDDKGESIEIPPARLAFTLPSADWGPGTRGRILNVVARQTSMTDEVVELHVGESSPETGIHTLNAPLATLTTEDETYSPQKIKFIADVFSGNSSNVNVPVNLNSDSGSVLFQTESSNFPNSDVTVIGNGKVEFGDESNQSDFVVNKSLTLKDGMNLKINSGNSLTISPNAKLVIGGSGAALETGSTLHL